MSHTCPESQQILGVTERAALLGKSLGTAFEGAALLAADPCKFKVTNTEANSQSGWITLPLIQLVSYREGLSDCKSI